MSARAARAAGSSCFGPAFKFFDFSRVRRRATLLRRKHRRQDDVELRVRFSELCRLRAYLAAILQLAFASSVAHLRNSGVKSAPHSAHPPPYSEANGTQRAAPSRRLEMRRRHSRRLRQSAAVQQFAPAADELDSARDFRLAKPRLASLRKLSLRGLLSGERLYAGNSLVIELELSGCWRWLCYSWRGRFCCRARNGGVWLRQGELASAEFTQCRCGAVARCEQPQPKRCAAFCGAPQRNNGAAPPSAGGQPLASSRELRASTLDSRQDRSLTSACAAATKRRTRTQV